MPSVTRTARPSSVPTATIASGTHVAVASSTLSNRTQLSNTKSPTHLTHRAPIEEREQQRTQHRKRLDEINTLLVVEQSKIDRLRAINRARRTLLAHRQEVLVAADSLLHNKLHTLIHQRLPELLSLLDSRLQRRLKSVRRQQSELLSLLFRLLSFRRVTASSLSLVGLMLPDNLDVVDALVEREQHATALAYLLRVVQLSANYLQIHLPFAMYFHPTFATLSSTSHQPPPPTTPSTTPSPDPPPACYPLSPVGWDGRAQGEEYRRGLALLAHDVVFLCRAVGMSDTVRLWRVGGNLLDLLQAVTIGLHERRRQELANEKATQDEQWVRDQQGVEEKEQQAEEEGGQQQQQQDEDENKDELDAQELKGDVRLELAVQDGGVGVAGAGVEVGGKGEVESVEVDTDYCCECEC